MVYRRKRSVSRRKTYKRRYVKRSASRKSSLAMSGMFVNRGRYANVSLKPENRVYQYSRYATGAYDMTCTGTEWGFAQAFKFDQIRVPADFTSLYDQYRINGVSVRIMLITNPDGVWQTNVNPAVGTPTNWFPVLWYLTDLDDDVAPTLDNIREKQGVKCLRLKPNTVHKIFIKPRVLTPSYKSGVTFGYSLSGPKWIDMVNTDVQHYGLKGVIDTLGINPLDTAPFQVRIEHKYYFSCRGVQ